MAKLKAEQNEQYHYATNALRTQSSLCLPRFTSYLLASVLPVPDSNVCNVKADLTMMDVKEEHE